MNKKKCMILALAVLPMLNSCSDWLDPKPLSFYSPENTYVDAAGLYAALTACERNMRHEFFGDGAPILTEMYLTDIAVHGKTDESGSLVDLDNEMLPSRTKNDMKGKNKWYWEEGFKGIKYANIAISRLDGAEYKDEAERNAVLGAAYFQRAYRYYKLTHQFGDVPYLDKEITEPKLDFYSYDRWSILEQCKKDLEFAYQWVPEVQPRGRANKDACGVLLMKICMAVGDFDRAIAVGKEVVGRHPLMTGRFTGNQTKPNTNLMHDLHSVEAKIDITPRVSCMWSLILQQHRWIRITVSIQCVMHCHIGRRGERLRHRTERRVQLLHQMKLIKIQKLIMIRNMDVVSVRAVRRTIISMKSGGKKRKTICAVLSTTIAGDGWKICVTTTLD